ncbi:MAG: hypothetical protein HND44_17405 [Chloroflexi bacterium]|nr:hypothetical protein [Ardenticatenaceae bacterium]MBL1130231.1 hypothetical protein [Chloroflexota bacterium]NOG36322.1 hypothetical protein [Chloroflexota bacterium]GIK58346.1 MAG: hypothetical protein BroJett015_40090 [Chloroflexota bacterium]
MENTNTIEKRLQLEQREHELHDQLTEVTRRLQMARAQVKYYEDNMERTLKELHDVRQQKTELIELLRTAWNGPVAGQPQSRVSG